MTTPLILARFSPEQEHLCGTFPEESISETVTCIMGLSSVEEGLWS